MSLAVTLSLAAVAVTLIVRGGLLAERMDDSPLAWVRRERAINTTVMLACAGAIIVSIAWEAVATILGGGK